MYNGIIKEIKKIFHDDTIDVIATCVRIPTRIGHGASVYVTFKNKVDIKILEQEDKRSFFSILTPRVVKVEMKLKSAENKIWKLY